VAADVGEAVAGLPDLVDQVSAVAAKVEALELEGLLTRLTDLAESADGILDTEGARRLPETVSAAFEGIGTTVEETNAFLAELRAAGAIDTLTQAIEEVDAAAADVGEAVAGLPELVEQISAVAAKVEATEIDALVAELTGLVESAEAIVGTESAQALPQSLRQTLDEVSQALAELRAGGTVESVNAALASAQQAADSVAQASQELPGLVNRTEAVLREAELALAGLADSGALNREARAALREVSRAADSVRSLARTLERKPNALLTGK
jgi:paraquat-inducible protein B